MSKKGMMTPSSTATPNGMYGVYYVDSLDNAGRADQYDMWEANNVAGGSVLYDANQNVAVYDGEHWVKDDGTEITNYVKRAIVPMQTVRGGKEIYFLPPQTVAYDGGADLTTVTVNGYARPTYSEYHRIVNVVYDGETYECEITMAGDEDNAVGDSNVTEYPFYVRWVVTEGEPTTTAGVKFADTEEHTIAILLTDAEEGTYIAILDNAEQYTDGDYQNTSCYVLFDGKQYDLIHGACEKCYIFTEDEEIVAIEMFDDAEHTVMVYKYRAEPTVILSKETLTFADYGGYGGETLLAPYSCISPLIVEFDGKDYEISMNEDYSYGDFNDGVPTFENYPFALSSVDVFSETIGTHSIEIKADGLILTVALPKQKPNWVNESDYSYAVLTDSTIDLSAGIDYLVKYSVNGASLVSSSVPNDGVLYIDANNEIGENNGEVILTAYTDLVDTIEVYLITPPTGDGSGGEA